jgi:hypothetical protein
MGQQGFDGLPRLAMADGQASGSDGIIRGIDGANAFAEKRNIGGLPPCGVARIHLSG